MAVSIPSGGLTLHGPGNGVEEAKSGSASAIMLRLSDEMVQDMKKASRVKDTLQFVAGNTPKLRIGGRTIDLALSADAFRNELYASTVAGSLHDLHFTTLVSHRASLKKKERGSGGEVGSTDEALAALRSSLASFEQEKQANSANLSSDLLPLPKNRFDAARKHKRMLSGGYSPSSPSIAATPQHGPAPTSAYTSESEVRLQAMKKPILHLLAIGPATDKELFSKTHVPKTDLDEILTKIAERKDGKWQLGNRAYRDLDVWSFAYISQGDRKSAIDNATKAYDRLRIGKEEKIWQKLLPEKDRGKGIVLSRLHLGGGGQVKGGLTPSQGQSPFSQGDAAGANTPRSGATTPRPSSSKNEMSKRLFSKDPKKARAIEDAKEKKRKDREAAREAAASDRENARAAKRQKTTKPTSSKIKSAEIVHSSDDESGEEGEVKEAITRVDSKVSPEKSSLNPANAKTKPTSASPNSSDSSGDLKKSAEIVKKKAAVDPAKSIASLATKVAKSTVAGKAAQSGKATPHTNNGLSAPSSQHKNQRSPQKADSRPNVPSPLGAARPRVASDVSDRNAIGVLKARPGAATPQGLGITNGVRKRQDTVTSTASVSSNASDKKRDGPTATQKAVQPASSSAGMPKTNGVSRPAESGVKRKAEEAVVEASANKHRKTESASSQSQQSHASSSAAVQSTARTSPDASYDGGSSDSAASVLEFTYMQGVSQAEKFTKDYYPAYTKMYDALVAKETKGETVSKDERERLWQMHRRLEQMKREIRIASERENRDD